MNHPVYIQSASDMVVEGEIDLEILLAKNEYKGRGIPFFLYLKHSTYFDYIQGVSTPAVQGEI